MVVLFEVSSFLRFFSEHEDHSSSLGGERRLIWKSRRQKCGDRLKAWAFWEDDQNWLTCSEAIRLLSEGEEGHRIFCLWSLKKEGLGIVEKTWGEGLGPRNLSLLFSYHTLSWGPHLFSWLFFFFFFYIGVQLINNVVLVSGVQQSGYTYTCSYSFSNSFPI